MAEGIRKRVSPHTGVVTYEASVWVSADRRRIRKTFPTMAAARSWRSDALQAVRQKRLRGPSGITFREAAETWIREARAGLATTRGGGRYKPSAVASYESSLRVRVLPTLGGLRLEQITRHGLQQLVDEWAAEGIGSSTIRNALMPLRVVFRRAVRRGIVAINPCDGLELPPPSARRERIASPVEAAALIDALAVDDRALWSVAVYAGLRSGEIQALRWSDVDLASGRIHVRRAWDPKARVYVDPKSRAGRRVVPIAGVLRDELVEHRMRTGRGDDHLVFGRNGVTPIVHHGVLSRARAAWRRRDLDALGLHEARHTAVSIWIAAGVNIRAVSTYAGHSSVAFTLERYGHLMPGDQAQAIDLLDRFLEAATAVH